MEQTHTQEQNVEHTHGERHTQPSVHKQAKTQKQPKKHTNNRNTSMQAMTWNKQTKKNTQPNTTNYRLTFYALSYVSCYTSSKTWKHIYIYRYIIICHKVYEAPKHNRWYKKDKPNWQRMHLIYAAPTSKPWRRHSTGQMETQLIDRCWHHESCINREGAGGECASAGDPHFVYIVVRWTSSVKTCINEHDTFSHMQQTIMILFHNRQHIHGPALFRGLHTHLWTCRSQGRPLNTMSSSQNFSEPPPWRWTSKKPLGESGYIYIYI